MTPSSEIARPDVVQGQDLGFKVVEQAAPRRKRRRFWRGFCLAFIVLAAVTALGRVLLPRAVRDYVNGTLDRNPLYAGTIGDVQIHLWRGAYSIQDVRISKTTGNVPVPLFASKRVDFAMEWKSILLGRVVGRVQLEDPTINLVDAPSEGENQTGSGVPWLHMVRDLFPFKINSAIVKNGTVHFRAYQARRPVDVYLSQVEASIDNLTNVRDETNPLMSTVHATALVMDQARLEYQMTLDPFSYHPTFHMAARLFGLDVTKINDLAITYGKFDFKRGWLDLVIEADAKEGHLTGYIKPLFRNLKVFSFVEDLNEANVLQFFWQALVGATTTLFKNQSRDQFGTLIPFTGDLSGATTTDILAAVGNILRNAFVRAYLPRLEGGQESVQDLQFGPPEFSDPISVGDAP